MSGSCPRVTVGIPVFNGEAFVAEALESLLKQTFSDFEIVVSDNASCDHTEDICRNYAARDPRVRYYRSDVNRGAAWNHNRVFEMARGEFFKWNSADDLCAPEFLARCVEALDQDQSAVMACSSVLVVDELGEVVNQGFIPPEAASRSVVERFRRNSQTDHWCFHIYSLIRSDVLRRAGPMGYYTGADRVLLAYLSLFGRCVLIPDKLLFNRDHPARFTRKFGEKSHQGTVWFDSRAGARKLFPYWGEFRGYLQAISRAPLRRSDRLRCYATMLGWFRSHKDPLLDDVLYYPRKWFGRVSGGEGVAAASSQAAVPANKLSLGAASVTVVVCTYNRSRELRRALESIAASQMPGSSAWEVLVVDNNSSDATREVVEDFCRRHPGRFRYLFEPVQGKSYALNAGIANAYGEILAFVDDDVTVEPRWLRSLTAELHTGDWAGAAGQVHPTNDFKPPAWLWWQHCSRMLCAYFDCGNQPIPLDMDRPSCGANMAFRKAVFEKYGGFRVDLGPRPNGEEPRIGEDAEFARRLMKAGESLRYEPLAMVYHPVLESRISKEFFLSRSFDFGRVSILEQDNRQDLLRFPQAYFAFAQALARIGVFSSRWVFARRAGTRFFWRCKIAAQAGIISELRRRLRSKSNNPPSVAIPASGQAQRLLSPTAIPWKQSLATTETPTERAI